MDEPKTVADVRRMLKSVVHVDAYDLARAQLYPEDTEPEADAPVEPQALAFLHDAGYDSFNVSEAREYIAGLTETEQAIALEYERRNRNRSGVLGAFD